jgi:hypothetical protein
MPVTFEVLTTNKATAEFIGTQRVPCRVMTSLCPDRCHHAHDSAQFKILEYEQYEKPGKYGDDKQETLRVSLSEDPEGAQSDKQDPAIIAKIKALSPGQKVRVFWEHIYVTDETNSKYPQRPVRSIEVI